MRAASPLVLLSMCFSGCVTTGPASSPAPYTGETAWIPSTRIELVSVSKSPVAAATCKADLLNARDLLVRARPELEPAQWELLDKTVTNAERAWVNYESAASASGVPAELPMVGARGLPLARGLTATLEYMGSSVALPLLILLWPSSSIAPECQRCTDSLLAERLKTAEALREVSKAAEQVKEQIEAGRQRGPRSKPADAPLREPKVNPTKEPKPKSGGQGQPPGGEPPCIHIETRGSAAFRGANAPPGEIRCRYACGEIQVIVLVRGNASADCQEPINFERAAREAAKIRAQGH